MVFQSQNYMLDDNLLLSAATLVAADAAGSVAYIDLGAANAYAEFDVVIRTTAVEVADNDERYHFRVQGSEATAFSTLYVLGEKNLGAKEVTFHANDTPPASQHVIHCDNTAVKSDTDGGSIVACRYVRIYLDVSGSVGAGINYSAYLVQRK